jgi:RNA methyltransferase, TrmH family
MLNEINSKDNPKIKHVIRLLTDSSYREKHGQAVVSGNNLFVEAKKHGLLLEVLVSNDSLNKYRELLEVNSAALKVYVLHKNVIDKINLTESGTDLIGIIKIKPTNLNHSFYTKDCIILENISDPGNLGTMLRAAAATGIENIILSKNSVDVYNPKVLRSSTGVQFNLNIVSNVVIKDFLVKYQGNILATTPYATDDLYTTDLTPTTAWVFGNEKTGISPLLLEQIAHKVKIPLIENVESLNVAMALTVCLFEMLRQRSSR